MKTLLIAAALTATLSADMCNFYAQESLKSQTEMVMFYDEGMFKESDRSKTSYKRYYIKAMSECAVGKHAKAKKGLIKVMQEVNAALKEKGYL